ncbi:LLM class flavin-dependent oxidoreductase [Ammoniphilus sp. CFH 90114]|uniref:LLM class flavin-dependent oxidoreductase n=1 Tax=Ammoniphilus sp. CFH 90114 TaxID=2493665 RepID=UPI0010100859|nr:LLM class flavin-dependent oxidoreductase [Ammoniphilus sp. CFH 90114]RXT13660.1 LLM class flavin-dependent oxidoreductase [Ammoniphilus sp. CFH 90114]
MKLSILDQSPISSGSTARQALYESMNLAQLGEQLGYTRYWIAEHHDIPGLACSSPEVMLGYVGANTKHIRLGSGAVLLPNHKPYKIAETYNLLANLFPGRVDIGIGRAPGGSAEASMALSDNFLEQVRKLPESLKDLLHFIHEDFPSDHLFSKISASPLPPIPPEVWLLGTSEKSAILAAEYGIAYAFGQFMSEKDGSLIMKTYIENFKATNRLQQPITIVAVSAICADTTESAEELALSELTWKMQMAKGEGKTGIPSIEEAKQYLGRNGEKEQLKDMRKLMVIGNPREVKDQLSQIQTLYQADEIMIVTITHRFEDRLRSYELIAKELWGNPR